MQQNWYEFNNFVWYPTLSYLIECFSDVGYFYFANAEKLVLLPVLFSFNLGLLHTFLSKAGQVVNKIWATNRLRRKKCKHDVVNKTLWVRWDIWESMLIRFYPEASVTREACVRCLQWIIFLEVMLFHSVQTIFSSECLWITRLDCQ